MNACTCPEQPDAELTGEFVEWCCPDCGRNYVVRASHYWVPTDPQETNP